MKNLLLILSTVLLAVSGTMDGIDNTNDSRWLSASIDYPHWIEIDLEQSYALDRMRFATGHTSQGPFPATAAAIV